MHLTRHGLWLLGWILYIDGEHVREVPPALGGVLRATFPRSGTLT
jgi:hypothetical protein